MESLESLLAPIEDSDNAEALFAEQEVIPENIDHIPADDTVSLYFRQMESEPLLTAEQEVALAKRIQRGLEAQRAIDENRSFSKDQQGAVKEVLADGQAAREHL